MNYMKPVAHKVDRDIFNYLLESGDNLFDYMELDSINSIWDILDNLHDLIVQELNT